eukprot:639185-Alexandrium_andersonii.AAC.1
MAPRPLPVPALKLRTWQTGASHSPNLGLEASTPVTAMGFGLRGARLCGSLRRFGVGDQRCACCARCVCCTCCGCWRRATEGRARRAS